MAEKLKREFIELLETDKEFRYTVAGYLGLSEVLRRMDRMEERMLAPRRECRRSRKAWKDLRKDWKNYGNTWIRDSEN